MSSWRSSSEANRHLGGKAWETKAAANRSNSDSFELNVFIVTTQVGGRQWNGWKQVQRVARAVADGRMSQRWIPQALQVLALRQMRVHDRLPRSQQHSAITARGWPTGSRRGSKERAWARRPPVPVHNQHINQTQKDSENKPSTDWQWSCVGMTPFAAEKERNEQERQAKRAQVVRGGPVFVLCWHRNKQRTTTTNSLPETDLVGQCWHVSLVLAARTRQGQESIKAACVRRGVSLINTLYLSLSLSLSPSPFSLSTTTTCTSAPLPIAARLEITSKKMTKMATCTTET